MGVNISDNSIEGKSFENTMNEYKAKDITNLRNPEFKENQKLVLGAEGVEKEFPLKESIRPSKIGYYLDIAKAVAARGTCLRRRYGAIIVNDDRIVSTGYVGASRGRVNCCDRGTCFRQENNIPSGTRYELCRSVHAEMNAIINASKEEMDDATMYLVGIENDGSITPNADCCSMCKRVIINSGIRKVIIATPAGYKLKFVGDWIKNDDSLNIHDGY